jgi:hypothetical protein
MPFRNEFRQAIELLAEAIGKIEASGEPLPVLVGGGAVELYTGSAVASGDFDLVTPREQPLVAALVELGFQKPQSAGVILRGLIHPTLGIGVDFVSGALMDGRADRSKIRLFEFERGKVAVIPLEDLIADRTAQALSGPVPREDLLDQGIMLFRLALDCDEAYLDRHLREETHGTADLDVQRRWVDESRKVRRVRARIGPPQGRARAHGAGLRHAQCRHQPDAGEAGAFAGYRGRGARPRQDPAVFRQILSVGNTESMRMTR